MSGILDTCPDGNILEPPRGPRPPCGPPEPQEDTSPVLVALPQSELARLAFLAKEEGIALADLLHRRLAGAGIRQAQVTLEGHGG